MLFFTFYSSAKSYYDKTSDKKSGGFFGVICVFLNNISQLIVAKMVRKVIILHLNYI